MPRVRPPAIVLIAHLRAMPEITGGMGIILGVGGLVDILVDDECLKINEYWGERRDLFTHFEKARQTILALRSVVSIKNLLEMMICDD